MTKFIIGDTIAHCTVFEDNQGCIDLIHSPKINPRTRHISIKYHHFREHVRAGHLRIQWISTKDQLADIFTKSLPGPAFTYLRKLLLGWDTVSQFSLRTQREQMTFPLQYIRASPNAESILTKNKMTASYSPERQKLLMTSSPPYATNSYLR